MTSFIVLYSLNVHFIEKLETCWIKLVKSASSGKTVGMQLERSNSIQKLDFNDNTELTNAQKMENAILVS